MTYAEWYMMELLGMMSVLMIFGVGFSPILYWRLALIRLEIAKIPILRSVRSQYLVFANGRGGAPSSRVGYAYFTSLETKFGKVILF